MTATVFGISTCDTVRKARKWLDANGIDHDFVDLRKSPVSRKKIETWLSAVGPSTLVNRRSTTWKQLDPAQREAADSGDTAGLLLANPTLIKRPVLENAGDIAVGFSDDDYQTRFSS